MLRAVWAVCFGATLLISRPLWLTARDYPHVPIIPGLPQPLQPLAQLLFWVALLALAASALAPRPDRSIPVVLAITALWAVLDQTRWQPYILTYAIAGVALLLAVRSAPRDAWALAPLQLALACTYVWSGLHKFNRNYAEHDFASMAGPFFRWAGLDPKDTPGAVAAAALATAAVEVLVGIGLMVPRTRRAAVVGAVATHAFILLMLGPLGSGTNVVVWPWNVFTAFAVALLFWPTQSGRGLDAARRAWWSALRPGAARFAAPPVAAAWWVVVLLFGIAPALSLAQWWDASLSFQLYAGKQRQATISYAAARGDELPPAARRAVRIDGVLDLAVWSMEEMKVTPVTEPRVVREIGRSLARRAPDAWIRAILLGPPDVLTGERSVREWSYEAPRTGTGRTQQGGVD
jgi:uncharacterized membrane protein YphA (DoxX/SURF4 family)